MIPIAVQAGQLIAGKYRVGRLLGRGGMGVVALATHEQLSQNVAIKILSGSADSQARARFAREARAASQLTSEHVARVFDVGSLDDGTPYMVMEYLDGRDLGAVLAARGPLPADEVAEYVLQACEGLGEAHSVGIVHRDIKPANLFLTLRLDGRPLVKVLDFGISKILGTTADLSLTRTQAVLGSPLYMSPEQLRATKDADARSDIWSLGVVLYELLSGQVPFHATAVTELAIRVVSEAPPPLDQLCPELPAGLREVVERCLAKTPEGRYPSVAELARALEPYATPVVQMSRADRVASLGPGTGGVHTEVSPAIPNLATKPVIVYPDAGPGYGGSQLPSSPSSPSRLDPANAMSNAAMVPFGQTQPDSEVPNLPATGRARQGALRISLLVALLGLTALGGTLAFMRYSPSSNGNGSGNATGSQTPGSMSEAPRAPGSQPTGIAPATLGVPSSPSPGSAATLGASVPQPPTAVTLQASALPSARATGSAKPGARPFGTGKRVNPSANPAPGPSNALPDERH